MFIAAESLRSWHSVRSADVRACFISLLAERTHIKLSKSINISLLRSEANLLLR